MEPVDDFEVFTRRLIPLARGPYLTIQRRGTISMNAVAFNMLGKPRAVELMFSRVRNVVGLRGVDPTAAEHAYPVRAMSAEKQGPYILAGQAFTKYYGIDTSASRRYVPTMVNGVMCVDIADGGTVVVGTRGRREPDGTSGDQSRPT